MNDPPPTFEDKTMDLFHFNEYYNSGQMVRVVAATNNENFINIYFYACGVSQKAVEMQ